METVTTLAAVDAQKLRWRKASRSVEGGECVEAAAVGALRALAGGLGAAVAAAVRDSKAPCDPALPLTAHQWLGLLERVRDGLCDLP